MKNMWGQEIRPEGWAGLMGHAYPEEFVLYPGGSGEPRDVSELAVHSQTWIQPEHPGDSVKGTHVNKHVQVGGWWCSTGKGRVCRSREEGTSTGVE